MESSTSNLHFLKQFFDRMEDGIFAFSGSGKLLDLNPAAAELIGYTPQELLKISFSKVSNVANSLPEKLKLKERTEWFLDTFSCKDGTSKTMFCQAFRIKGEEGQETSYWLHVRLPKSSETSEVPGLGTEIGWEVLERFFDMNPLPMAITEIETGKYLKVNQQFCIQVKYSEEEILGRSGVDLGFWSSLETRDEVMHTIKKKGFVRDLEIQFMNRLGEEFWGLLSAHPIEFGGSLKLLTVTVPITDRVKEEFEKQKLLEEFKENEEILTQIIRLNPTAITLSRSDGTYLEANDLFLEFVGKTREEVIGKTPVELGVYYDLEDRELIRGLLSQKGLVENLEVKMGSPEGKIRSILFSARVLETGGERKILAIGHDITHIKEAQEDLRDLASELEKSKELFQKLFQLIPSYVVLTDLVSKKVVDVNERFMEFVKVTREEVVGKETIELPVWNNDPETRAKIYQQLLEKGEINNIETIFTSTDGTSIPVLYSGRVINLNGRPHVISLGTDISERTKAEAEAQRLNEEVQHNKELFEKIFHMNPAAVSLSDLATGTYMQVNEAYCELIGYTKEEIIGKTSFQLGIWKTNLDRGKILKELQEVGWSKNVEAAINHSDGTERHVISGNRVFMVGDRMVLLALLIDITDKKKVESERDQYLAQLEESKDLFEKVFDMNPDTVTISDLETGKYINVNSMFHDLMQYNKEEVIGRTVMDLGIWADPEQRGKLVKQLQETGILRDIEVTFKKKDDSTIDTIFSARTVNLLGRPALVAISKDNTLAKAVAREKEEEGKRLSEQTRMLLNMATDSDFASGNMESGLKNIVQMCTKTLDCDRASVWLFKGKERETLTLATGWDRKYNEFMEPSSLDLSDCPSYFSAITTERFVDAMDVIHDPRTSEFADSYSIPLEIDSLLDSPIFLRGELHGVICLEHRGGKRRWKGYEQQFVVTVAEQVTQLTLNSERREAKEELEVAVRTRTSELASALDNLRKTQDQLILSEKMAALGQLVAGIAHEINNPLGAISALSGEVRAYLDSSPERLQKLGPHFAGAEPSFIKRLVEFMREGNRNKEAAVSREERRSILKRMKDRLNQIGFENPYDLADRLMDVGMYTCIDDFPEIFQSNSNIALLDFAIEEIQNYKNAASIRLAVDRTSKIVYALKSFSHIDSSGGKIDTDLAENIETVLTIYHNQIKNGVEVELDFQARPIIPAYPDDLIQVWTNLIYNSLQAMQFKGKIKIAIQDSDSDVSVLISDNGPGIPPEIKAKIFDPFYTTKAPGEGSGLGLDISRRIVLKHGGRIEFSSKPGKTVFKVILPKS
ncbi:PAS domain S-box protein [Leptospira semungkisensis]|uniref:histidine kinase n=1 Tax=Leptospira semungkisensis TaxID=2484985 RepID=A0A4R9G8K9_9LEPT|nr:PAS domain S-box protein [Leptospira semungkisensis]TGK08016.1 PAS domain S-box protein [Leptospira semungkisensis]